MIRISENLENADSQTVNDNQIDFGQMRFIDNYIPQLQAGSYNIEVTQTLQATGSNDQVNVKQVVNQEFVVDAPRFAIPANEIHHYFPPPNVQGVFNTALPQIVLTHRALPWERTIWENSPETPWMALIVLDQEQIMMPQIGSNANQALGSGTGSSTINLTELLNPSVSDGNVLLPDIDPQSLPDEAMQIQVLDITPDGFTVAVPNQDVLRMLASVREVNISDKTAGGNLDMTSIPQDANLPAWVRWFSVITSNRFPAANQAKTQVVHLVSLEGFTDYLKSDMPKSLPTGKDRIRMVSLASWSFTSLTTQGQNFSDVMEGLAPATGATLAFTLPFKDSGTADSDKSYAQSALKAGYVPRSYRTAQGEATYAWYRGPFVPSLPARLPALPKAPVSSAQLAIYDETRGIFDMSYATAFETGRLLALRSQSYCSALMRWQRRGLRLLSLLAERAGVSGIDLTQADKALVEDLARPQPASKRVFQRLRTEDMSILHSLFSGSSQNNARPRGLAPELTADDFILDKNAIVTALESSGVKQWLEDWAKDSIKPLLGFLAKLWVFESVPYNVLVPDDALLPAESFRAFYVDRNWQLSLLQGALAVGLTDSRNLAFQQALRSFVLQLIENEAGKLRTKLLGLAEINVQSSTQMCGFLMRSTAVSGWPGLQAKAYHGISEIQRKVRLPAARFTRLALNVALGLYWGLADWIEIDEPREGIHFGVQSGNVVYLRNLTGPDVGSKQQPPQSVSVKDRIDSNRVLDVLGLASDLQTALSYPTALSPAEFALELIDVPESMVFRSAISS